MQLRPKQAVAPLTSEDFDGDGAVSFFDFFNPASGFGSGDPILDLDRDDGWSGQRAYAPRRRAPSERVRAVSGRRAADLCATSAVSIPPPCWARRTVCCRWRTKPVICVWRIT